MTPRQREQMREWKRRRAFGVKRETWREQYEIELEKFLAWCVLVGVPFKWAMMRAMQTFAGAGCRGLSDDVVASDGRRWVSGAHCGRDLGVTTQAVCNAIRRGSRCKGVLLTREAAPRRLSA